MALHCIAEETEPQTRQMLWPRPGTVSWFLLCPQINPAGVPNASPSSMGSASLCLLPESLYLPGLSQACSKNSGGRGGGGPSRSSPKCGCLCCLSWRTLGPWQCTLASLGLSNNRHLSNSGCLGRGRYVYLGQGPGRGCGFLPTPFAPYTDRTVLICLHSLKISVWSTYWVLSTLLQTSLTSEHKHQAGRVEQAWNSS